MSGQVSRQERVVGASFGMPDDPRGTIQYFELPEQVNLVGSIRSRPGDVRGNHFHPDQEQKLWVISGRCLSLSQDVDTPEVPVQELLVEEGMLIVTPPRVVHAVIFLAETLCVNLVQGIRDLENYDQHTKPHMLVEQEEVASYAALYDVTL